MTLAKVQKEEIQLTAGRSCAECANQSRGTRRVSLKVSILYASIQLRYAQSQVESQLLVSLKLITLQKLTRVPPLFDRRRRNELVLFACNYAHMMFNDSRQSKFTDAITQTSYTPRVLVAQLETARPQLDSIKLNGATSCINNEIAELLAPINRFLANEHRSASRFWPTCAPSRRCHLT